MYGHPSSFAQNDTLGELTRRLVSQVSCCLGEGQDDIKWAFNAWCICLSQHWWLLPTACRGSESLIVTLGICLMGLTVPLAGNSKHTGLCRSAEIASFEVGLQLQRWFFLLQPELIFDHRVLKDHLKSPKHQPVLCRWKLFPQVSIEKSGQENSGFWLA